MRTCNEAVEPHVISFKCNVLYVDYFVIDITIEPGAVLHLKVTGTIILVFYKPILVNYTESSLCIISIKSVK